MGCLRRAFVVLVIGLSGVAACTSKASHHASGRDSNVGGSTSAGGTQGGSPSTGGGSDSGGTGAAAGSVGGSDSGGAAGDPNAGGNGGLGSGGDGSGGDGSGGNGGAVGSGGGGGSDASGGVGGTGGVGGDGSGGTGGTGDPVSTVAELEPGDLVISEVMIDPEALADSNGEWFEIYNASDLAFDLEGLQLGSDTSGVIVDIPVIVQPAGYAVMARVDSGNIGADFVYGTAISLGNFTGNVSLRAGAVVIDTIQYDTSEFPVLEGTSMSLRPGSLDAAANDAAANWCIAGTLFATGDLGTPDATNVCLGSASDITEGDLIVTEIMKNPTVQDLEGEWFEIFNASTRAFDLEGLTLADAGTDGHTVSASLVIRPGQFMVMANNDDDTLNGGVPVDYSFDSVEFQLANGADEVILYAGAVLIDSVAYDDGVTFPDPSGESLTLDPEAFDSTANDDAANWCVAQSSFGDGDLGTPGTANDNCD